jgi:hypothetical protein
MLDNVIIIPYRKRQKHLDYYIKNTLPLIKKHLPNSKVIIIEQDNDNEFNRGKLLNVVFKEYKNKTKYFITNDVDVNPKENTIEKYYNIEIDNINTIIGIYTSSFGTLGGIIKVRSDTIHKINGFPNDIWGWGAEDKALQNRSETYGINKQTNFLQSTKRKGQKLNYPHFTIFDDANDRDKANYTKNHEFHYKEFRKLSYKNKVVSIQSSGLNNISYEINDVKSVDECFDVIKVNI